MRHHADMISFNTALNDVFIYNNYYVAFITPVLICCLFTHNI